MKIALLIISIVVIVYFLIRVAWGKDNKTSAPRVKKKMGIQTPVVEMEAHLMASVEEFFPGDGQIYVHLRNFTGNKRFFKIDIKETDEQGNPL